IFCLIHSQASDALFCTHCKRPFCPSGPSPMPSLFLSHVQAFLILLRIVSVFCHIQLPSCWIFSQIVPPTFLSQSQIGAPKLSHRPLKNLPTLSAIAFTRSTMGVTMLLTTCWIFSLASVIALQSPFASFAAASCIQVRSSPKWVESHCATPCTVCTGSISVL